MISETLINRVVKYFAFTAGASAILFWFVLSYFENDAADLLVYPGNDAHCLIPQESIGLHCFGDYASIRFGSIFDSPNPPGNVYPPSTRVFLLPFHLVDSILGFRWGLLSFIFVSVIALLLPIFFVTRNSSILIKVCMRLLLGFFTLPFVFTIDRGNPIALAIPGIFFYLVGKLEIVKLSHASLILFLISAVSIKPQFIGLVLLSLLLRAYKDFLKEALVGLGVIFVPFVLYGRESLNELQRWIHTTAEWSKSLSLSKNYPSNFSFARGLEFIGLDGRFIAVVVVAFCLVFLALSHVSLRKDGVEILSISVILGIIALSTPIAYGYYTSVFLPLAALFIMQPHERYLKSTTPESFIVMMTLVFTISPLVIPSKWGVQDSSIYNLSPILSSLSWLGVLMYSSIKNLYSVSSHFYLKLKDLHAD